MPKRPNPFGDCSPLQLKQHVGKKEIDLGVARDQNMKKIYEKTRQLLFSASKKSFMDGQTDANQNVIEPFVPTTTEVPMEEEPPTPECRQMQITACGRLTHDADAVSKEKPKSAWAALFNKKKVTSSSSCQCCKGQAASQDRCGFCEKSVCNDCIRPCSSCEGHFCQLCSVMKDEASTKKKYSIMMISQRDHTALVVPPDYLPALMNVFTQSR